MSPREKCHRVKMSPRQNVRVQKIKPSPNDTHTGMHQTTQTRVEIVVFPESRRESPYSRIVDQTKFLDAAREAVRTHPAKDPGFVKFVRFSESDYPSEEVDPWLHPNFLSGEEDEEEDAYDRRKREMWRDMHDLLVNENGLSLRLGENEYFSHMSTRSGHRLLGTVVMRRTCNEMGCGDSVWLPVDGKVLAANGLPDPRDRERKL